jgi:hypothetical protein
MSRPAPARLRVLQAVHQTKTQAVAAVVVVAAVAVAVAVAVEAEAEAEVEPVEAEAEPVEAEAREGGQDLGFQEQMTQMFQFFNRYFLASGKKKLYKYRYDAKLHFGNSYNYYSINYI